MVIINIINKNINLITVRTDIIVGEEREREREGGREGREREREREREMTIK